MSLSRRKRAFFTLVVFAFSVVTALLAGEVYLRWNEYLSWRGVWLSLWNTEVPGSELAAEAWVVNDPELGYRINPNQAGFNSLGIRYKEIEPKGPDSPYRILVIGDSVAWPREGFCALFGGLLDPAAEVINAATPGYTTYQERIWLDRIIDPIKPDLVLAQYCLNDNHHILHRFDANAKLLFTEDARAVFLPEAGDPLAWMPRHSHLALRLRAFLWQWRGMGKKYPWEGNGGFGQAWQEESWRHVDPHLEAMQKRARSVGAEMLVVAVPFGGQFRTGLLEEDRDYVLWPQSRLKKLCDRLDLPLLDLFPVLEPEEDKGIFHDTVHFTELGHRLAAEAIAERIADLPGAPKLSGRPAPPPR